MRISLLQIAQLLDKLLARHIFIVGVKVLLRGSLNIVDENVGVRGDTGDSTDHVTIIKKEEAIAGHN